jgi:hypothetical protein
MATSHATAGGVQQRPAATSHEQDLGYDLFFVDTADHLHCVHDPVCYLAVQCRPVDIAHTDVVCREGHDEQRVGVRELTVRETAALRWLCCRLAHSISE